MSLKLYRVTSPEQVQLFEDDIRAGIRSIFDSAGNPHRKSETEILLDIAAHVSDFGPAAALWFVLGEGDLKAFLTAKIYYDGPKRSAAITWMWSAMHGELTPALRDELESWCVAGGATALYCSRSRGEDWFTDFVKRYGFERDSVVYRKSLGVSNVHTQRYDLRVEPVGATDGIQRTDRQTPAGGAEQAVVRPDHPRPDGADGAATGNGDQRAAATGGVVHATADVGTEFERGGPRGTSRWWRKLDYWRRHGVFPPHVTNGAVPGGPAN